jgi:hypothetical protein
MPDVNFANEVVTRAWRLADLAGPVGLHRRDLVVRLRITSTQYRVALDCAVREGWVKVSGRGPATRVADVRTDDVKAAVAPVISAMNPQPTGRSR